jgi:hypothetical protein
LLEQQEGAVTGVHQGEIYSGNLNPHFSQTTG